MPWLPSPGVSEPVGYRCLRHVGGVDPCLPAGVATRSIAERGPGARRRPRSVYRSSCVMMSPCRSTTRRVYQALHVESRGALEQAECLPTHRPRYVCSSSQEPSEGVGACRGGDADQRTASGSKERVVPGHWEVDLIISLERRPRETLGWKTQAGALDEHPKPLLTAGGAKIDCIRPVPGRRRRHV